MSTTTLASSFEATAVGGGFDADPDTPATYKSNESGDLVACLDFALELLGRFRENGEIVALWVRITSPGDHVREVTVPASAMIGSNLAEKLYDALGEPLTLRDARLVSEWLTKASRTAAAPTIDTLSVPVWEGDVLQVPGVNAKASFNGAVWGPDETGPEFEADAFTAWQRVVTIAAANPKLGIKIGASAISAYVQRLGIDPFVVHDWGESTRGKTRGAKIGVSVVGNPDRPNIMDDWDGTANGLFAQLAQTGGLPFLLDETGAAKTPDVFASVIFGVSTGRGRTRSTKTGEVADRNPPRLVVLSTGERRLTSASGFTGTRARVIELQAPSVADRDLLDEAYRLATEYAGWPLFWLLNQAPPSAGGLRVPTFDNDLLRRLAPALGACRLGFEMVARSVGLDLTLDLEAVAAELGVELEQQPVSTRLYNKLWEHFVAHDNEYLGGGRYGRDLGDAWLVFPEKVRELAGEIGIDDPAAALAELRNQGRLTPDADGRLQGRKRVDGKQIRVYVLVKQQDD